MRKNLFILTPLLVLHLFLLINFKFTAWPEMILWPYLWIHGILPYKDVAIVHTPLLLMKLAIFYKLFGVGILQLKIFTWTLIIFTDALFYWIVKKLWNSKVALVSLSIFILWQIFFDGNGLWFELLIVPISLLCFYFISAKKYFWAGLFWALAFFTKQTAVFFLIPIGLSIVQSTEYRVQRFTEFITGGLIIIFIFALILVAYNLMPSFYQWAIHFGIFVLPRASGQIQIPDIKNLMVAVLPFGIFLPFVFNRKTRNLNLLVWAVVGSLGAYPRFEYFHFQPAVPFLAIASGIVLTEIKKNQMTKIFITLYILGSIYLFFNYFMRNWGEGTRFYEQDVIDVSNYVSKNTKPGDKIFVMNWWDNIYALTNTLPATDPWIPQLSWYQEVPGIQEKEVMDLEKTKPKLIIFQDYADSGLAGYIPENVYDYVISHYKLKEKVDGIEILIPNK
jgi:hypothetical protein